MRSTLLLFWINRYRKVSLIYDFSFQSVYLNTVFTVASHADVLRGSLRAWEAIFTVECIKNDGFTFSNESLKKKTLFVTLAFIFLFKYF